MNNNVPVPGQRFSIRIARIFAMTLIFVCAGTLIQFAVLTILFFGYAVLRDAPLAGPTLTSTTAEALSLTAEWAGLTGLVTGVYDATYDRVDARTMLVISLVMAFASLILTLLAAFAASSTFLGVFGYPLNFVFFLLLPAMMMSSLALPLNVIGSVVSMMACWKLIDIARDRIPAAGRLLGQ